MQPFDLFEPPPIKQEPPPRPPEPPSNPSWWVYFFLSVGGFGSELIRAYADPADLSSLRIRTGAMVVNFIFGVVFITIGGMPVFAVSGTFNVAVPLIAVLVCSVKFTMERFLSLRGLFAAGMQAVRKQGLKIAFGSDDVAWNFAFLTKISADICLALIVGNLVAQTAFGRELTTYLAKTVAPQTAVLVNYYRPQVQAMIAASEKVKIRDAAEAEKLKGDEESLRKQQVLDVRRGTTRARDRQPEAEASRLRTNTTLSSYEAKALVAKTQAASSAKAHEDLLRSAGARLDALVKADPAYVAPPEGLLARMSALRAIGKQDDAVFWGEVLIEGVGVLFEMFLLVLSIARCPTHLSECLYLDYYRRSVERVVKVSSELKDIRSPPVVPVLPEAQPSPDIPSDASSPPSDVPPSPAPKRGRGRPRTSSLNGQLPAVSNIKQEGSK